MVILINRKTKIEYPIPDQEKGGVKTKAGDVAADIMQKYPAVFELKTVENEKSKEILKEAKSGKPDKANEK